MIAVLHLGHTFVPLTSGNLHDGQKSARAANDLKALEPAHEITYCPNHRIHTIGRFIAIGFPCDQLIFEVREVIADHVKA